MRGYAIVFGELLYTIAIAFPLNRCNRSAIIATVELLSDSV